MKKESVKKEKAEKKGQVKTEELNGIYNSKRWRIMNKICSLLTINKKK